MVCRNPERGEEALKEITEASGNEVCVYAKQKMCVNQFLPLNQNVLALCTRYVFPKYHSSGIQTHDLCNSRAVSYQLDHRDCPAAKRQFEFYILAAGTATIYRCYILHQRKRILHKFGFTLAPMCVSILSSIHKYPRQFLYSFWWRARHVGCLNS